MLWITDLSIKDPYYITPLVMGFTMWYQNKLNPPATGGDQTTAKMMKYLPILFTFMFLNFPSGLVLYWLFNNILAIGQQYLIKKDKMKRKELAKQKRR
jgi:YidC/Oxa1 family membrane protein insertase